MYERTLAERTTKLYRNFKRGEITTTRRMDYKMGEVILKKVEGGKGDE